MDANGQRFWLLGDARHFPAVQHAAWNPECRVLRLASERALSPALSSGDAFTAAQAALEAVPRAIDELEGVASWDAATSTIVASSYLPGTAPILPLAAAPSDLCAGADGILYIALAEGDGGGIRMHDLRGRWEDVTVALAGFTAWRLTPSAGGGVWAMERTTGRLAHLTGRPLRAQTPRTEEYNADVFRPSPENGCAPAMSLLPTPVYAAGERPLALAAAEHSGLAVLTWFDGSGTACVRRWDDTQQRLSAPLRLTGASYAYSLTWLSAGRIAVRVPGRVDAPAFDLAAANANGIVMAMGEVYPLSDNAREASFANGAIQPPHYPSDEPGKSVGTQPLYALSLNNLARRGEANNFADTPAGFSAWLIDSKDNTTVWNRVYAEAAIPAHTGFVLWLSATNVPRPPALSDLTAWHPHGFGRDIATLDDAMLAPQLPRAAWEPQASELPGHPGLLGRERTPGTCGLFSVLVQNSRQRVRTLVGRYLWVHVVMHGDGRVGPDIAALRAWGSRFSYADKYLPRIYRESLFGDAAAAPGEELARIDVAFVAALNAGGALPPALRARLTLAQINPTVAAQIIVEQADEAWLLRDASSSWRLTHEQNAVVIYRPQASGADFTARMLANFEGVLTQMEDRVAAAHLLSDPAAVPEENLDWLAGWIGVAFDAALPAARRRDWLRAAPDLARAHGTRNGLRLALDIATGGGVRGGEIVVIEDFRLRRILATLLGVDMSEENDPLLPGLIQSGNSIVGDTLFVGDHDPGMRSELAALFNDAATTNSEDAAAISFYEKLAFRCTILVHREVETQDFALIRRIAQLEAPAHVEVRVVAATWPLLVGVSSLVGVDTYLGPPRPARPVRVDRSSLGMGDFLIGQALLDPRLSGTPLNAPVAPPVADAGADQTVAAGNSFILDGSASQAAPGHGIEEYRWRLLPPEDI
ncbi:phage tail protein [Uliginosibacterium sp. H3]|uniref:Phage tail protein n=1 Tax=Uliginosibacterium silvisoli TaxID=3114758 RepID=A0ABU6K120_9RHOO|nr:phage tail protein [Uliginosibacterium sp. H3]